MTFVYDKNIPLYEQSILPETKALLSILYSDYLCSKKEKEKWDEYDKFEQQIANQNLPKKEKNFAVRAFFLQSMPYCSSSGVFSLNFCLLRRHECVKRPRNAAGPFYFVTLAMFCIVPRHKRYAMSA